MSITTTHLLDTNVVEPLVTEALAFGDCQVRQPDMVDPVTGTAAWIGQDACVEVPFERLGDVARLAREWNPIGRPAPESLGIQVTTLNPQFVHPAFQGSTKAREYTLWAEFSEVLTDVAA